LSRFIGSYYNEPSEYSRKIAGVFQENLNRAMPGKFNINFIMGTLVLIIPARVSCYIDLERVTFEVEDSLA